MQYQNVTGCLAIYFSLYQAQIVLRRLILQDEEHQQYYLARKNHSISHKNAFVQVGFVSTQLLNKVSLKVPVAQVLSGWDPLAQFV